MPRRVAGVFGAVIRAEPSETSRIIGTIPAGAAVEGEITYGETVHDEGRYVYVQGYVWLGRTREAQESDHDRTRPRQS